MSDQNLNIQVAATATGDGLRKTAEEVKALNAETAKSAPIAAEATTREERLAAVRERQAEAARQQAAEEEALNAKREAAFAQLDAMKAQGGGQGAGADAGGGESLLGVGVAAGAAAAAVTAATMVAKSAVDMLMSIPQKIEEARLETERLSAELAKQAEQWLSMAKNATTASDVLQIQKQQREELSRLTEEIEKNKRSGNWWDVYMSQGDNAESVVGWFFDNSTKRIKKLEEERRAKLALAEATERTANREKEAYQQIENLPPTERLAALSKAMTDLQERQGSTPKFSEHWNDFAVQMEQIEKRIKGVNAEIEKGNALREKEGRLLDDNMRKEGERFAEAEKARQREEERAAKEKERLQREGDAIEDAMERERQKNAREDARAAEKAQRERERMEENNARALERVEREARQEAARDAREARRYAPVSGGTTFGAETAPDIHAGPSASFQTLRKSSPAVPAVPDISASQDEVVRAMRALSDQLLRQQRANIEVTRAAQNATSQSYERS